MQNWENTPDHPDFLNDKKFIAWRLQRTPELNNYWAQFRREHPECTDELNRAIDKFKAVRINNSQLSGQQLSALWERIQTSRSEQRRSGRRMLLWRLSAAASIALVLVSGLYFAAHRPETQPAAPIVGERFPEESIRLHTGREVVTLAQDAEIVVDNRGRISVADENVPVVAPASKTKDNKLVVPYGKRATLTLADGTKVWLNSGTELVFPGEFTGSTRDISVSGEIYLEVAKNAERPFRVHTDKLDIRVLGTKFNVSAYADDPQCAVVLVAGKVAVETGGGESVEMAPSQMTTYDARSGITRSEVDVEEYISWKDNVLLFQRATIAEILQKIGRYYNVSFNINDKTLSEQTCTGKLYLASNIDDIMLALTVISNTSYKREDNTVYITQKNSLPME